MSQFDNICRTRDDFAERGEILRQYIDEINRRSKELVAVLTEAHRSNKFIMDLDDEAFNVCVNATNADDVSDPELKATLEAIEDQHRKAHVALVRYIQVAAAAALGIFRDDRLMRKFADVTDEIVTAEKDQKEQTIH